MTLPICPEHKLNQEVIDMQNALIKELRELTGLLKEKIKILEEKIKILEERNNI